MKKIKTILAIIAMVFITIVKIQAQEVNEQKGDAMEVNKEMYSCPMHADVTSDKPGKCSKCGMNLKMKSMDSNAESMNMENGKMNMKKCGMKMEMSNGDTAKGNNAKYSCPMHSEVTSGKAGKCSKCGMTLEENEMKKDEKSTHNH